MNVELPPLPYTDLQLSNSCGEPFGRGFTEDDMQEYAKQAVLAERKRLLDLYAGMQKGGWVELVAAIRQSSPNVGIET